MVSICINLFRFAAPIYWHYEIAILVANSTSLCLQPRNKMVQRLEQIAWAPERARHPRSGPSQNSQHLVDFSSHGSGNGKRNRRNLKQPLEVSAFEVLSKNQNII